MTTQVIERQLIRSAQLGPRENFEQWKIAVSSLFTVTCPHDDARDFRADLASYNLGCFLIAESSASAQHFHRSEEHVAAAGVDHLLIQLYLAGECRYDADGGHAVGAAGDIVCFDLSRPMSARSTDLETVSLILPRSAVRLAPPAIDSLHGARLEGASSLGILVGEHLKTLVRIAPRIAGPEIRMAAEATFAVVSSGFSKPLAAERPHLTDTGLRAIQIFIERNLADASLSTESIMREFALSRSALYRLFEPIGGIAEYIRERRLKLAFLKLASVSPGKGAVAKLAFGTGFSSEVTFSRAFQRRFGMSPSEAIRNTRAGTRLKATRGASSDNWMQDWLDNLGPSP